MLGYRPLRSGSGLQFKVIEATAAARQLLPLPSGLADSRLLGGREILIAQSRPNSPMRLAA